MYVVAEAQENKLHNHYLPPRSHILINLFDPSNVLVLSFRRTTNTIY